MAAIHALFRYAALRCPEHAELIARVLAIPTKRCDRPLVVFLTRPETEALLAAPDNTMPLGQRDQLLLVLAVQTGLRVSELTALTCSDVTLGPGAHVRCTGKGRKERCTPLTKPLARQLHAWLQHRQASPTDPLFPNLRGGRMSTDAVERLLTKHVAAATSGCPSLKIKNVTTHTLRHTCAMNLLRAAWTPAPSHSGSVTRTPKQRRRTYTPTSSSRSRRSPSQPRPAPPAASATGHPIRCWPSSRASSYPARPAPTQPRHLRRRRPARAAFGCKCVPSS